MVVVVPREVRRRPLELERAQRGGREVDRGLGAAAPPQRVQRPDHAGPTGVEALQRQRLVLSVPFVRGPERLRVERRVGVRDDRGDRILDPRRHPRLVDQSVELRRLVEHRRVHRFLLVDPAAEGSETPRHAVQPGT
jgi:hypothetical protein